MAPPERPLGLSILAIVSLSFGLYNLLSAVYLTLALLGRLELMAPMAGLDPEIASAYAAIPTGYLGFLLATSGLKSGLLIASGIGYLQLKRFGRLLGTAYAIVSITESVIVAVPFGVTRDSVIGALFAIYTLVAVNTMWKNQLTR